MSENSNKWAPEKSRVRTTTRGRGQKMSKAERDVVQEAFLNSFRNNANVRLSCMAAGVHRNTVYAWLEHDEQFSLAYKQAEADANDVLRAEIQRRGVQGYEEPVVSRGEVVYDEDGKMVTKRVYSDTLLIFLAKARMGEFREKQQVEHSGTIDVTGAKEQLLAKLEALRQRSGVE